MFTHTYGTFGQAREGMKMAMYGAISFLTNFVLNNANDGDADKEDYIYNFNKKDVVLIPVYNGFLGEIENMRIYGLKVDDVHNLYVKVKTNKTDFENEYLSLNDACTDIIVVGAVWNILENLFQYFD